MEVRGPCLIILQNGQPCHKYEVGTTEVCFKGYQNNLYYFETYDDAELYVQYLTQVAGIQDNMKKLKSKKVPEWELVEIRNFLKTIDTSILENKVAGLKFEAVYKFTPKR